MTAVAMKQSVVSKEVLNDAVRAKMAPPKAVPAAPTAVPVNNPFYAAMFNESLTPEAKRDAFRALATFTGTKEESRSRIKEYAEFKEYLQLVREQMATEIIRLQDTETFSILQNVMNNLNGQLIDFEKRMAPLTDITDAIYKLRTEDATLDVFTEIQTDKDAEAKKKRAEEALKEQVDYAEERIRDLTMMNARYGEKKMLFGFGPVTKSAREAIAENLVSIERSRADLGRVQDELVAVAAKESAEPGKYSLEKAKLRELLDLTSEQHKDRQKQLVASALNFVQSAKRDIGDVRVHLEKMSGQIENLLDNNGKMSGVYAIMGEGIEEAQKENFSLREGLLAGPADERQIGKMQREEKKMAVDDHIRQLDDEIRTTAASAADLTSQTIRVKAMKDANAETLATTQALHSQGVASIADRLSVTLQAVSSAALGESSAAAKETLKKMSISTDRVAQRESIRVAMGVTSRNNDIITAIDNLAAYGEVQRAANDITRQGISEIRENLDKLKALASQTQDDLHDGFSAAADATKRDPAAILDAKPGSNKAFQFK